MARSSPFCPTTFSTDLLAACLRRPRECPIPPRGLLQPLGLLDRPRQPAEVGEHDRAAGALDQLGALQRRVAQFSGYSPKPCASSISRASRPGSVSTIAPRRRSTSLARSRLANSRATASRRVLTRAAISACTGGGETIARCGALGSGRDSRNSSA